MTAQPQAWAKSRQKRGRKRRKYSKIPLLGLQLAVFNAFPTPGHKAALADLLAKTADRVYAASFKRKERK